MKFNKIALLTVIFLSIILSGKPLSQIVNKFGIKGGVLLSKISLSDYNPEIISSEPAGKYNFLSIDAGLFVEFFDSRYFCVSTELHFRINGETDNKYFEILVPDTSGVIQNYVYKQTSDRFHYLSLQFLPRWKYIVNSEDKLYIFAGPKLDFRIGNYSSVSDNAITFNNSKLEIGFSAGIGNEIWDLLTVEARFEHNITTAYSIIYGNQILERRHDAFFILAGFSLKKILKINL